MNIFLVRHGDALSAEVDPERPLSGLGRKQAEKAGNILLDLGARPERIIHSPKLRAKETAGIISEILGTGCALEETPGLLPNDPPSPIAGELEKIGLDTMIVGHLPFLGRLLSLLLAGAEDLLETAFRPAGIAWVAGKGHGYILKVFVCP